jgi:hypothetical protein
MTHSRFLACVATILGLVVAGATPAQAEMTHWSYTSSASPNPVRPDNWLPSKPLDGLWTKGFNQAQNQTGSANILAIGIVAPPDAMTFTQKPYSVQLTITDKQSHMVGTFSFSGFFNGSIDPTSKTSTVTLTLPASPAQSKVLGLNRYTVALDPFGPLVWTTVSPGSGSTSAFVGTISAHVDVSPANGTNTPEPTSLALVSMGLVTAAGAVWRRRRV